MEEGKKGVLPELPCGDAGPVARAATEAVPTGSEVWAKRRELGVLTDQVARLRGEIRRMEEVRARSKLVRLPPHQRRVVQGLVNDDWDDETCWYSDFATIASWSGLSRAQVSRACKALRRLGFMEYGRGLFTDDGEVAGSGYRLTRAGHAWWWEHESPPKGSAERLGEAPQTASQVPGMNPESPAIKACEEE